MVLAEIEPKRQLAKNIKTFAYPMDQKHAYTETQYHIQSSLM